MPASQVGGKEQGHVGFPIDDGCAGVGWILLLGSTPLRAQANCNENGIDDATDIANCPPGGSTTESRDFQ